MHRACFHPFPWFCFAVFVLCIPMSRTLSPRATQAQQVPRVSHLALPAHRSMRGSGLGTTLLALPRPRDLSRDAARLRLRAAVRDSLTRQNAGVGPLRVHQLLLRLERPDHDWLMD